MKKTMLTVDELVQYMKDKGIQFTITTDEDAKKHLCAHNNYFKLRDLGELFNFNVSWDGNLNTIIIDSSASYTP